MTVHPRAGGGARCARTSHGCSPGPSPRRRGSHRCRRLRCRPSGSIPAQAGEPSGPPEGSSSPGVHPRAGGGAFASFGSPSMTSGPSPRRRGSQRSGPSPRRRGSQSGRWRRDIIGGSIPAQAGEPLVQVRPARCQWVHPRAGGGAEAHAPWLAARPGPSPRRRGSLALPEKYDGIIGSIPAQAGEPGVVPRRRGSRALGIHDLERRGSIPAQAGEPILTRP